MPCARAFFLGRAAADIHGEIERWSSKTASGISAARAAGMAAIGFVGGSHCVVGDGAALSAAGAAAVLDDMRQLVVRFQHLLLISAGALQMLESKDH
jgi:hypothetical protein